MAQYQPKASESSSTEAYVETTEDVVQIHGYLYKATKDGKWQRRWFATNGSFLTYYKSKKMTKLLAALSLPQCGAITRRDEPPRATCRPADDQASPEPPPPRGAGFFSIQLNDRVYDLRAPTRADAELWVATLLVLKTSATDHLRPEDVAVSVPPTAASKPRAAAGEWKKKPRRPTTFALCCPIVHHRGT